MKLTNNTVGYNPWDELTKFSNLNENQQPKIDKKGLLLDPTITSWTELLCCGCCDESSKLGNVVVYDHLLKVVNVIIFPLKKNDHLSNADCDIVKNSISNFNRLAMQYEKANKNILDSRGNPIIERMTYNNNAKIDFKLYKIKNHFETATENIVSYQAYLKRDQSDSKKIV